MFSIGIRADGRISTPYHGVPCVFRLGVGDGIVEDERLCTGAQRRAKRLFRMPAVSVAVAKQVPQAIARLLDRL